MRLKRNISIYLIQGCFLALMTVLSPFGYSAAHQSVSEPKRTELVEQDRYQVQAVPEVISVAINLPKFPTDFSGSLTKACQRVDEILKQTAKHYLNTPRFRKKTTHSTSSEDEPLSDFSFA